MTIKHLACAALLAAAAVTAHAQNAASAASAASPSSPAKKELVQRLLALQQPALENMARNLVEQPARQMMASAAAALQGQVPADRREAIATQIQSLVRKYLDESLPLVKEQSAKIGAVSLAPLFEEKFSEEELAQLLNALESPAYKKFQLSLSEMSNAYAQKLVEQTRSQLDPKLRSLEQSIAALFNTAAASTAPKAAKPAASAASGAKATKK